MSNWWLMTEERYLALNKAGVSLFSISLDFPDERHDDFRAHPRALRQDERDHPLPRQEVRAGEHRAQLGAHPRELHARSPGWWRKAEEWGTQISFSAYSALRTGDMSLCITAPEDLALLRRHIDYLKEHRRRSSVVMNSDYILEQTYRFFAEGGMNGCQAGRRFVVVRPDGLINACSMFPDLQYASRKEAAKGFKATRESCDQCYVSIRASTERGTVPADRGQPGSGGQHARLRGGEGVSADASPGRSAPDASASAGARPA